MCLCTIVMKFRFLITVPYIPINLTQIYTHWYFDYFHSTFCSFISPNSSSLFLYSRFFFWTMAKLLLIILWKEKRKNHVKNDGHCCFSIIYFLSSSSFVWICGWVCVCVCMWGKLRFCPAFHSLFICWYHICIYCTIFESFSCSTGLSRNLWKSSGSYRFSLKMLMVCKWINFFLPIWIIMQVTPGKKYKQQYC